MSFNDILIGMAIVVIAIGAGKAIIGYFKANSK